MKRKPLHLVIVPQGRAGEDGVRTAGASFLYAVPEASTLSVAKLAAQKYYDACIVKPLGIIVKRANGKVPAVMMDGQWLTAMSEEELDAAKVCRDKVIRDMAKVKEDMAALWKRS